MNSSYKPLPMSAIGGRNLRRRQWRDALLTLLGLALVTTIYLASRPRVAPRPIANLQKNGVHGVYNLHAKNGELLLFNFRAIEEGKLYRCSRFPRNHRSRKDPKKLEPAAFYNDEAFEFLRARNIRTVIILDNTTEAYGARYYFNRQGKASSYYIRLINYAVPPERVYSRDTRERHGGLRAAIEIINELKNPVDGAVLLMGDSGKDAVGVAAAAYELWRNAGDVPADQLWEQVKERYLVSDVLIKRDKQASKFSKRAACKDNKYTFVCPETIEALRPDLERIAQVD